MENALTAAVVKVLARLAGANTSGASGSSGTREWRPIAIDLGNPTGQPFPTAASVGVANRAVWRRPSDPADQTVFHRQRNRAHHQAGTATLEGDRAQEGIHIEPALPGWSAPT